MNFSDSHTHIYLEDFNDDLSYLISEANQKHIKKFYLPNIDIESIDALKSTVNKFPNQCFPMMGLHPCSVKENYKSDLEVIKNELYNGNYVAVGEIGLDLYWDKTFFSSQVEAFKIQISWAKALQLPIAIHVRNAFSEIFDVMDEIYDPSLKGVFHCFTGTSVAMNKILKDYPNFMFGIGGVVTFKNSGLDKVVTDMPLEKIILETDAPYLAPVPFRGKRNIPVYLFNIAEKVAQIKGISLEKLSEITENNMQTLFGNQ
ncbi:MAG: TatD family hydrolase [Vicingaceae bacterium]